MEIENVAVTTGVAAEVDQIGTYLPVPGLGVLPVNCFVLHARCPMLVDAGVVGLAQQTLAAVRQVIDPAELRFIYLTHTDADHIGCLRELLAEAPHARIVTTFLGMGKLGLSTAIEPDRVLLLNSGEQLDLGDRRVIAGRPPSYDAPETTWLRDLDGDVLFSSDCFGALLPGPFRDARSVPPEQLQSGLVAWAGIDAPWLWQQDRTSLERRLAELKLPRTVLGAHLPPAVSMGSTLLQHLAFASQVEPAPAPNQAAFEAMLGAGEPAQALATGTQ